MTAVWAWVLGEEEEQKLERPRATHEDVVRAPLLSLNDDCCPSGSLLPEAQFPNPLL